MLMSAFKKYKAVLTIQLKDALTYRAEGLVYFAADLMAPLLMMIAWKAIYESHQSVAGYSADKILFYYLLIFILRTVLSVYPNDLSKAIRIGALNALLVKPFNILVNQIASEIAWKAVRVIFLVIATVFLLRLFFSNSHLPSLQLASPVLAVALLNAFFLNYFIKAAIELTAFWTSDTKGLRASFYILEAFFSGTMLPLNLLPSGVERVAQLLPYKFFYYFPIQIILGQIGGRETIIGLITGLGWLVAAMAATNYVMRLGLRRYSAYSG